MGVEATGEWGGALRKCFLPLQKAQEKMVSSKEKKKKMTSSSTKHGCTYCDLWSGSSHPGATRRMCLRPEARAQRREDPVVLHFTERL